MVALRGKIHCNLRKKQQMQKVLQKTQWKLNKTQLKQTNAQHKLKKKRKLQNKLEVLLGTQ